MDLRAATAVDVWESLADTYSSDTTSNTLHRKTGQARRVFPHKSHSIPAKILLRYVIISIGVSRSLILLDDRCIPLRPFASSHFRRNAPRCSDTMLRHSHFMSENVLVIWKLILSSTSGFQHHEKPFCCGDVQVTSISIHWCSFPLMFSLIWSKCDNDSY